MPGENIFEHYTGYIGGNIDPKKANETLALNEHEAKFITDWFMKHPDKQSGYTADQLGGHTSIYFGSIKY
jgi:hypothetical protein